MVITWMLGISMDNLDSQLMLIEHSDLDFYGLLMILSASLMLGITFTLL